MSAIIIESSENTLLTTVEIARAELGLSEARISTEDLERKIQFASDEASAFCNRRFGTATYRERFRSCRALESLVLDAGPAFAIVGASLGGVALLLDQYELEGGELFMVTSSGRRTPWYASVVEIEYQAGWKLPGDVDAPEKAPPLPSDIQRAVLQLVGASISQSGRGDPMLKVSEVEGIGRREYYVQGANAKLPHPEAEATLSRYVRMVLA